jgi:hypothetical protein
MNELKLFLDLMGDERVITPSQHKTMLSRAIDMELVKDYESSDDYSSYDDDDSYDSWM